MMGTCQNDNNGPTELKKKNLKSVLKVIDKLTFK